PRDRPPLLLSSPVALRLPPPSTLFPYTTLFRSRVEDGLALVRRHAVHGGVLSVDDAQVRAHLPPELPKPFCEIRQPRLSHHVAQDRKSTRLNSSHVSISYAVFCLKRNTPDRNTS